MDGAYPRELSQRDHVARHPGVADGAFQLDAFVEGAHVVAANLKARSRKLEIQIPDLYAAMAASTVQQVVRNRSSEPFSK